MMPEFSRTVALARIPEEGREERLEANAAECAALARRFAIPAVNRLRAVLRLRPEPGGTVLAEGRIEAEVVQDCVVTLEPVVQQLTEAVALRILPEGAAFSEDPEGLDEVAAEGDAVDLGEALAEQLALALDPYPRAPGAALPREGEAGARAPPAGPFAALGALRRGK